MIMRKGRIPDEIYEQIETNSRHTHTYCDECAKEVKTVVEHPYKNEVFICQECEVNVICEREDIDI